MPIKLTILTLLLTLPAWWVHFPPGAPTYRVWAINDGEKVEQDDLHHPGKASNSVWDGRRIKLFGARNEVIAFQVIVEADRQRIDRLTVSLPELRLKGGQAKIAYAPPADRSSSRGSG